MRSDLGPNEEKKVLGPVGSAHYGSCRLSQQINGMASNLETSQQMDAKQRQLVQQESDAATSDGWLHRASQRVPCFGIMLTLCASFFLGSAGMLVKLTTSVHGVQVAVFRAFIQLILYLAIIFWRKIPLFPNRTEIGPVAGRAILGAASITCSYFALKLIPLGDATVIRFSLPIWTLIVGYLALGESCNLLKVLAVLISLSGVVLIAKPESSVYVAHLCANRLALESDDELARQKALYEAATQAQGLDPSSGQQLQGSLLALASSICLALSLIALRLCRKTPAEVTIIWLSIWSLVVGTACLLTLNEWHLPDNWPDLLYMVLNGLCGAVGQWFITSALKVEQSGLVSLARTFDIQVAFLYSAFLLHEQVRATSIVGSLLVSSGVVAVVLPKWLGSRASRPAEERARADPEAALAGRTAVKGANGAVKR